MATYDNLTASPHLVCSAAPCARPKLVIESAEDGVPPAYAASVPHLHAILRRRGAEISSASLYQLLDPTKWSAARQAKLPPGLRFRWLAESERGSAPPLQSMRVYAA